MRNKTVGYIVIGLALMMGLIIYAFNRALAEIINNSCDHGTTCPMWGSIRFHTDISLGVMGFVIVVGLYLIFFGDRVDVVFETIHEKIRPKTFTREAYASVMETLTDDEKDVLDRLIDANGNMYQSHIVEGTGFSKVKVTRILDRLEARQLLERRRRGMTNVVMLK